MPGLESTDWNPTEGAQGGTLVVFAQGDGALHAHAVPAGRHSHIGLPNEADGAFLIFLIRHAHLLVAEPGAEQPAEREAAQPPAHTHTVSSGRNGASCPSSNNSVCHSIQNVLL